mmetsp:Transcript_10476/g.10549  ORF Transcript_10476/g.10549 Transcript_10476/m.10549 type:complete len:221 (-) Transcript_10476:30-692(-)
MRWLDEGIEAGEFAWCCSPTLTHLRPAAVYTHWPDESKAIQSIIKLEEIEAEGYLENFLLELTKESGDKVQRALQRYLRNNDKPKVLNVRRVNQTKFCQSPRGCLDGERTALIEHTNHTNETIAIINRLYSCDFELHGYNKLLQPGENDTFRSSCYKHQQTKQDELLPWNFDNDVPLINEETENSIANIVRFLYIFQTLLLMFTFSLFLLFITRRGFKFC